MVNATTISDDILNSLRELFLGEIKNAGEFIGVIFSESSVASFEDAG